MPNWKKVLTSGSSAQLNHITSSGNISASRSIISTTGSFGWIGGNGGDTTIGTATTGLNLETAGSSIYTAINNIDIVLDKLAPSKPPNLSSLALGLVVDTGEIQTLYGTNGQSTSSVITDTSPAIKPGGSNNTAFWDGDVGTLTAQRAVNDGSFTDIGQITLTTDDNTSGNLNLNITSDEDKYTGVAGSEGFWTQLQAVIGENGRDAGTDKYTSRLIHSLTGTATDINYYVEEDGLYTTITNTNTVYSSGINGQHYQSGIPYLGYNDSISSSYTCTINANSNFLNDSRYIGSTRVSDVNDVTEVKLTVGNAGTSWTAGQVFNTTASLVIRNDRYHTGAQQVEYEEYKSTSTTGTLNNSVDIQKQMSIDSWVEDETNPSDGSQTTYRSGSGTGQFPSFVYGAAGAATTFGKSFDTELSLKTANHYELQFSNRYFHWPASTNYTSYFPPGPDYSSMTSDSHNTLRWATFNLGVIGSVSNPASSVDIKLANCYGFDNYDPQTNDGFEMYLKVMDGDSEVTKWIDCNATYNGGNPGDSSDGDAGVTLFTTPGTSGHFLRTITFGTIPRTGTVYVRVGWNVDGGTAATNTTVRKFEYIYIT